MRNLPPSLMTGYKHNRRHRRSRARHGRKVSNKLHGDPGRSGREIIKRLAWVKASKECGVFRRTRSQEEFLKMPLHLLMLGRCDVICVKGKPVPVVHRSVVTPAGMTAELPGSKINRRPRIPIGERQHGRWSISPSRTVASATPGAPGLADIARAPSTVAVRLLVRRAWPILPARRAPSPVRLLVRRAWPILPARRAPSPCASSCVGRGRYYPRAEHRRRATPGAPGLADITRAPSTVAVRLLMRRAWPILPARRAPSPVRLLVRRAWPILPARRAPSPCDSWCAGLGRYYPRAGHRRPCDS